jgi:hypothetical protein
MPGLSDRELRMPSKIMHTATLEVRDDRPYGYGEARSVT